MLLATALLIVGLLLVVSVPTAWFLPRLFFAEPLASRADHRHDGGQYWYIVTRNHRLLAASLHEQRDLAVGTALGSTLSIYC